MRQSSTYLYQQLSNRLGAHMTPVARPSAYSIWEVTAVIYSVYLLLASLMLALLLGSIYVGVNIILSSSFGFAQVLGSILVVVGGGGSYFVGRFFLFPQPVPSRHRILTNAEDQPRLFRLLHELAKATGTKMPTEVFFSSAFSVRMHYPANFLGLLLPYPIGIEIGLGLVNSLSVSEFEAALTHELSLAPRRQSRRGYIYALHCVLYNVAHQRTQQDCWLDHYAATRGLPGWIAQLGRWFRMREQRLLQQVYWLSRNHCRSVTQQAVCRADQQTIRLVGSDVLIASWRRTAFGRLAYQTCSQHLNKLAEQGQMSEDIYTNHRTTLMQLAAAFDLPLVNQLPVVGAEALAKCQVPSRIKLAHPGRSYPSRTQREQEIQPLSVDQKLNAYPAWKLFKNASTLRRTATQQRYASSFPGCKPHILSPDNFARYIQKNEKHSRVSSEYLGFYDQRFLQSFEPTALAASGERIDRDITYSMIYNEENREKIALFISNRADLETLKQIQAEPSISSFEYDGIRYRQQEAGRLLITLGSELAHQDRWLSELDRFAFLWHLERACEAGVSSEYVIRYQALMCLQKAYQHFSENQRQVAYWQDQLLHKPWWTEEETKELTIQVSTIEATFKGHLGACPELASIQEAMPESQWQNLIPYLRSEQMYHLNVSRYDQIGFARLVRLVSEVNAATEVAYRRTLESVTDYQLGLREAEEVYQR